MATPRKPGKVQILRLFLDMRDDEIRAFKIMCLRQNTTMKAWMESVVREHIRRMDTSPILKYPPSKPLKPVHGTNGRFTGELAPAKRKAVKK